MDQNDRNNTTTAPDELPRYMSAKQAADLLGVNRATVINWARQGKFGGLQYGHRGIYRFDRREIMDFIERSRLPGPTPGEDAQESEPASGQ